MINTLYLPELREMLVENDTAGLRDFCGALHPGRIAEFMEGLSAEETWAVINTADAEKRAEIFGYLPDDKQVRIVETTGRAEATQLVTDLPADDRADLLSDVDDQVVEEILPLMEQEDRRELLRIWEYAEGTAGAMMTTEVARLSESLTVQQAMEAISRKASRHETIYYNYIVDAQDHLMGLISARQLITHFLEPDKPITELMQRDVVSVLATDDQEHVAEKVAKYDFIAIPVVDHQHRLLGIITHDDIIDVMREEATEDAHLSVGVGPLDQGYLETHWYALAWKRGVWLTVLFFGALLTIFALHSYETSLNAAPWLVLFLPLVISSGGNTGNQSATLVITAMTNGELKVTDWLRVMRRELVMGICLGGLLATFGYLCALIVSQFSFLFDPIDGGIVLPTAIEATVIPITLICVALCGALCGGLLPLMFKGMGLDPALMSNPFVAGIVDIAGIVIYMTVALSMLQVVG